MSIANSEYLFVSEFTYEIQAIKNPPERVLCGYLCYLLCKMFKYFFRALERDELVISIEFVHNVIVGNAS